MPALSRPWVLGLLLALAFVAGGASPLRAGTSAAEDAIVRQLERLTDAVKDLGRRDVKVECRCGS